MTSGLKEKINETLTSIRSVSDEDFSRSLHPNASKVVDEDGNEIKDEVVLRRDFKPRHVSMIAIAGAIGTGLIIGSGTALKRGGPASLLIGYLFTGSLLIVILMSLGELAAFSPMDRAFSGYATRYVDRAFGFAVGWNYFFKYAVGIANNLSAIGIVIQYWREDLNIGIFVSIFLVAIVFANFFNVRWYGELDFWCSTFKFAVLVICFITCIVITCGGGPSHQTIGFQYWRENGFQEYLLKGSTGRFLGFWACVIQSCFSYIGSESVGIVFGESPDPKRVIVRASKQVLFRIGFFYIFGVFVLGLAISPVNKLLATASGSNAAASPYVIAFKNAKIKGLSDFVNAGMIIFISASANTGAYLGSRTLYGLAKDGFAPRIFLKQNKYGVPYFGCLFSCMFGLLAYMNTKTSSAVVFSYFTSTVTVFGILTWINILVTYICYYRATVAQNIPREDIPFRMWGQPYAAYVTLFFTCVICFFNGYNSFIPTFKYKTFITTYVGIIAYLVMIISYKLYHKTKFVGAANAPMYNYVETTRVS